MKQMNWKELPHAGAVLKAGNTKDYKTGSWRTNKPRWIEENCIQCLLKLFWAMFPIYIERYYLPKSMNSSICSSRSKNSFAIPSKSS